MSAYLSNKDSAARRGITHTITYEYFLLFAVGSSIGKREANEMSAPTVDRIFNLKGYEPGNIQILTRYANIMKYAKYDAKRNEKGMSWQAQFDAI